jgi:hypothetical protein
MSCLRKGTDNNSAAHCPLKASQSIPSKLINAVTTDAPFRRDRFDMPLRRRRTAARDLHPVGAEAAARQVFNPVRP